MSSLSTYIPPLATAMPVLTTFLGFAGFGGGLYTFLTPIAAPVIFGIIPPTSMLPSKDQSQSPTPSQASLIAYIRVHGIRNLSTGLGLASISLYSLLGADSQAEATTVRRCLGVMLLAGAPVALGDGWLIREYVRAVEGGKEQMEEKNTKAATAVGTEKAVQHTFTALFIAAVAIGCLLS